MSMIFLILVLFVNHAQVNFARESCSLKKKEKKEIIRIFGDDTSTEAIQIPDDLASSLESLGNGDCIHRVKREGIVLGYLLSTSAKGRFDVFDYSVIFSDDLSVLGVMVTTYRSTHGFGICQKRWLNQFKGYSGGELELGRDIDAVTGATFSASSMVKDIQRCLHLLTTLKEEKLFE